MAPVGADDEIGADRQAAVLAFARATPAHAAVLLDEIGRLGLHQQTEVRIALGLARPENPENPIAA